MAGGMIVYYNEGDPVPQLVKLPAGTSDPTAQVGELNAKVTDLNAQNASLQGQIAKLTAEKTTLWSAIDAMVVAAKADDAADNAAKAGAGVLAVQLPPRT